MQLITQVLQAINYVMILNHPGVYQKIETCLKNTVINNIAVSEKNGFKEILKLL